MLTPWKKSYDKPRQCIKKQWHHFANKGMYSQSYGLSSSHLQMWELDHKEGWVLKNWWFWIVVQRMLLTVPWTAKEIKPGNPKGSQPWILIGRADAEAEAPILKPCDVKSQVIGKDPDAGKDWRQEKKGMTEDEMVGCYHWLSRWVWANSRRQWRTESLVCCSLWGCKESDTTEWLSNNKNAQLVNVFKLSLKVLSFGF